MIHLRYKYYTTLQFLILYLGLHFGLVIGSLLRNMVSHSEKEGHKEKTTNKVENLETKILYRQKKTNLMQYINYLN
jgi:hypothetical protein